MDLETRDKRDKIEIDILGRIFARSRLRERLETLSAFPQGRFAGTAANRAARAYIQEEFKKAGLVNVRSEPFAYTGWERGPAWVELPSGRVNAIGLPGTPPAANISAELVDLGPAGLAEFETNASRIKGRFVLASSAPITEGKRDLHRNEKFCRAAAAGAAGFLYTRHLPGLLEETGSIGWDRRSARGAIPAAGLTFEAGERLRKTARDTPALAVRLSIESRFVDTQGGFPIGELPGKPGASRVVIVGGHFDGHDISPAAVDNGTGIAFVMELADLFAPYQGIFPVALRFMGFDAEEMGLLGSKAYVDRLARDGQIDSVAAVFNIDCPIGQKHERIGLSGHAELAPLVSEVAARDPESIQIEMKVSPASDHFPFAAAGIPALYQCGGGGDPKRGRGVAHTAADTFDKINFSRAKPALATAASILLRLAAADPFPGRRYTPAEVQKTLAGDTEEALKAQKEWPF